MAKRNFGLGKGLNALIPGASDVMATQPLSPSLAEEPIPMLPIDSIIPNPRQPRRPFSESDPRLLELSASIKVHGLLQPIVVTRLDNLEPESSKPSSDSWFSDDEATESSPIISAAVQYQIIAGERRWRAARLAGLKKVPAVIKDVNARQMLELALIENIQRADLNPVEEALAYQALTQEFGLTQEAVAKQVGKDRTTISNLLSILRLAPRVREMLINQPENFTEGHARPLVNIASEEDQVRAMEQIVAQHLTVRQAEELAGRIKNSEDIESAIRNLSDPPRRSPELEEWESHFRDSLCVKVDLKCNKKGKGTLVLHFNSQDELDSLYNRLVKGEQ